MLFENIQQTLLQWAEELSAVSTSAGHVIELSLERSTSDDSVWVSPIVQRLASSMALGFSVLEKELQTTWACPNGISFYVAKNGLLHICVEEACLLQECEKFSISGYQPLKGQQARLTLPVVVSERNSACRRARLWCLLYEDMAKSLGASVARQEEGVEPEITVNTQGVENTSYLFQTLKISPFEKQVSPEIIHAVENVYVGLERAGRPLNIEGGAFINLKNPLFSIFYAEHLIVSFHAQIRGLKVKVEEVETASISNENEALEIMRIVLIWRHLKVDAYGKADLRPAFLHAIALSEYVIKWYNGTCLWDERNPEKVKARLFVLNAASLLLGDVLAWARFSLPESIDKNTK